MMIAVKRIFTLDVTHRDAICQHGGCVKEELRAAQSRHRYAAEQLGAFGRYASRPGGLIGRIT
jgi:hypothetical protein